MTGTAAREEVIGLSFGFAANGLKKKYLVKLAPIN